LAVIVLGVLLLFFCALLWLTVASRARFNPRNRPEVLLTGKTFESLTNLPELAQLTTNLSAADLAFGEEQMAKMANDRPEFARFVTKDDAIWQFCARAFAGAAIGERIVWDNTLPQDKGYRSENLGPYNGRPGFIRIRNTSDSGNDRGRPLSCEELWSCAVFEIENIRNHKAFMVLFYKALDGNLTREEWVRGCSMLEYNALQRTKRDFIKLWLPLRRTRQVSVTRSFWGADITETYEAWISLYQDPNDYPWNVFGAYYDNQVVPYVKKTRGLQSAPR
jgi:hypothetical protein